MKAGCQDGKWTSVDLLADIDPWGGDKIGLGDTSGGTQMWRPSAWMELKR